MPSLSSYPAPFRSAAPAPCVRLLAGLALACAVTWPGLAQAASFRGPVTVSLIAPGGTTFDGSTLSGGPLNLGQTVAAGGQILPGDGGDIGNFMLFSESITLSGTSILVRVAQGASDGSTGYLGSGGEHARYVFNGLDVAGEQITGLSYGLKDNFGAGSFVGASNAAALVSGDVVKLASAHSVVLTLDQIRFADRGQGESANFVDFRIDLKTTPVPEPGSGALALVGLAGLSGLSGLRWARARSRLSRR